MKTIYKSSDGNQFDSRRECKLYEDALVEVETLVTASAELHYEMISGKRFYKINSYAELWLFDNTVATSPHKKNSKLYDLFTNLKEKEIRFPIWFREDARASKKSAIEELEAKMDQYKEMIEKIRDEIQALKSLDSRSKSPLIESIDEEELEIKEEESTEIENNLSLIEVKENHEL